MFRNFMTLSTAFLTTYAMGQTLVWRSTYYDAVPNKKGVTALYCKQHTPGTFVVNPKKKSPEGISTNLGIKMQHFTYNSEIKHGIYFIHGSVSASGKRDQNTWTDHISYYVYKLTDHGTTRGAWSSDTCKGLYIGEPLLSKV